VRRDPAPAATWGAATATEQRAAADSFSAGAPAAARPRRSSRLLAALGALVVIGVVVYLLAGPGNGSSGSSGSQQTVSAEGTSVTMTLSQLLDPAPVAPTFPFTSAEVVVAVYVTLKNVGSSPYPLDDLAFGIVQAQSSGSGVGQFTSAGPALPQTGTLEPGASVSGWVTSIAEPGPVTGISVGFNARTATSPADAVSRVFFIAG
jgi:hypothetical protein